ncbi:unnamed protein product [Rodentolepis nana]|uniref:Uncharacterized protein n=1 Tax=Rodentolepis nana TaxID=102285 RepID=A0A0R3TB10_RODNA|nr:unnamed protein product [Rodentolepis nana]
MSEFKLTYSAGRIHVLGKMVYSLGKSFSIRLRLRASASFRQISDIPGKWLIFCHFFIDTTRSTETERSVQ